MKTIPNKVIYTKEEFAELQKEFESLETEVKNRELHLNTLVEFVKKLQTILDFDEKCLTAKELFITHNAMNNKTQLHSK